MILFIRERFADLTYLELMPRHNHVVYCNYHTKITISLSSLLQRKSQFRCCCCCCCCWNNVHSFPYDMEDKKSSENFQYNTFISSLKVGALSGSLSFLVATHYQPILTIEEVLTFLFIRCRWSHLWRCSRSAQVSATCNTFHCWWYPLVYVWSIFLV